MATTATRAPTSDEAVAGTWTGSAGSRFGVVDDYPDTAGTDELTHGTTAGTLTFGFTAFAIPAGSANITVFVDYYDYKNGSQACTFGGRLKVGASYFNATTHNPANGSGSRTQRTDTWATNPATSAAWTVDQINGIGANALAAFGYNSGSDASPSITTSSIQLRVTYDAPITGTGVTAPATLTMSATGTSTIAGAGVTAPGALVLAATGTVTDASVNGVLEAAPGALTLTATGTSTIAGAGVTAPGALTLTAEGSSTITGAGVTAPAALTLTATGSAPITGSMASPPDPLTLAATGASPITGEMNANLGEIVLVAGSYSGDEDGPAVTNPALAIAIKLGL